MVDVNKADPEVLEGATPATIEALKGPDGHLIDGTDLGVPGDQLDKLMGLKTVLLQDLVDDRLFRVLAGMTPEKIDKASLSVLNATFKNFVEKRQLLRGMPTEIVDDADRSLLREIMPRAMNELKRRGLVDGTGMVDVTPEDQDAAPKTVKKEKKDGKT